MLEKKLFSFILKNNLHKKIKIYIKNVGFIRNYNL